MYEIRFREECSHVVRLLIIKKLWKLRRQTTMMKNIAIIRSPIVSRMLGSRIEMPCSPSAKKMPSSVHWKSRNHRKIIRLFSPTQLPTQGQWWS
jgi:hypothetical protein